MKKYLFWLIIPWFVWACNSPNGPSRQTNFSAYHVSNLAKLEAKTSTDRHGINLNLSITNIAGMTIYPAVDSVGHSLVFSVFDNYGQELISFYDRDFERDYWTIGLKQDFAYAGTYLIASQDLPAELRYGKIKIRLYLQDLNNNFGQPFELEVDYDFANY